MKKLDVAVIGKERRTACMAQVLSEQGLVVEYFSDGWGPEEKGYTLAEEQETREGSRQIVQSARAVVGSIPFSEEERALQVLRPGQLFFGGMLSKNFEKKCMERGISCFDFMREETIAVYNAIATAEGVIAEAIKGTETNLHGSECLVLGYGRCGKVLCDKLKGMSARVTVVSCEEVELGWAGALGLDTLEFSALSGRIQRYDYIFNTIPKVILGGELLEKTRQGVLIVDIASGEGGIDYKKAEDLGRKAMHCLGLPGKYAPMASAQCLSAYVVKQMKQAEGLQESMIRAACILPHKKK